MRRRLAIGLALVGLALALIYLLNSWSIRTAPSSTEPQSARFSQAEQSLLKGMTAIGPARAPGSPGLPGLAAVIITPWYSADSGVIRNALVLILSFVFLGGAIAVVAHRADPRVYVASDVEQILSFPPMAQLPDFSEVAHEITEEHLLRLASGIDLGFRDRGFRRCVVTGTDPEAGVTTVATRLKKLLETMGRAAVVVNAGESLSAELRKTGTEPNRQPRLLEWIRGTSEIQGELVLVDAAPLVDSEETERLVQSADCTIVVIESGVTTRAQLRTVANILQRIKAPAVGFVLNRIRLATADPEFRRSIREMGKQLRRQGQSTDWQMLKTLEQAIEEGRASLDLDAGGAAIWPAEKPPEVIAENIAPFDGFPETNRTAPATVSGPAAPAEVHGIQLVKRLLPESVKQPEEFSFPPAEIAPQLDSVAEPETEQIKMPAAASGDSAGYATENPAPETIARVSLPRLSDLRGMRFSQAIRDLDLAKRPVQQGTGLETLMSAIAPFETLFKQMEASTNHDKTPEAAPAEFDLPPSLRALIPIAESGALPEANNGIATEGSANGNQVHANPVLSKPAEPEKSKDQRREENDRSRPEPKAARQKPGGPFEQVQILPSRRGQYKKKG